MSTIVYLNGSYVPLKDASVSPFDRGFLMADGIYEVTSVIGSRLIDYPGHLARLQRSMFEMKLRLPCQAEDLLQIHREIVSRNEVTEGGVYLQLTRGAPDSRDFLWPDVAAVPPTLLIFAFQKQLVETAAGRNGIRVKTVPDLRWQRCDIKTVQLLYSSQSKTLAHAEGFDDVWMTEKGTVTEGSSSNAYIVRNGRIVTRHLSNAILHGITRAALVRYASESEIEVEERPFSVEEAYSADEAFATSSTGLVQPVVAIDKVDIGCGIPGPVTRRLREIYIDESIKAGI